MTYGTLLRRSRHGTLHFRFVIPRDVRARLGQSEVSISLGTANKRDAEIASLELQLAAKRLVLTTREAVRMNEPAKPNQDALRALIDARRFKALVDEIGDAESATASAEARAVAANARAHAATALAERLVAGAISASPTLPPAPLLSVAVAAFKAEHRATGTWTPKTADMWDSRLRLMHEWFGDPPVSELSREAIAGFMTAITKLPKNATKQNALDGLGLRQLIELAGVEHVSAATVNQIMQCVTALFAWMDRDRNKWKVSGNVAKGLKLANVERVQRVAFDEQDLRAMFTSPEWTARKFLHSYGYWLLPLGLFTGARINELCQIDLKDFGTEHGHPVISLCTEGLRRKTTNARRTVPVHPELVRLGLLRHVERLRNAGETKLFPECSNKRDGHGQDASRWFGKFKTRAGITDPRKVFHSARHSFASQLNDAGVDVATGTAPLLGHAATGESTGTYWNEKDVRRFVDIVKRVTYPVVTELVPVVEEVQFQIDVHRGKRRPPVRRSATKRRLEKS